MIHKIVETISDFYILSLGGVFKIHTIGIFLIQKHSSYMEHSAS